MTNLNYYFDFFNIPCRAKRFSENLFFEVYELELYKGCNISKIKRSIQDINALTQENFFLDTSDGIKLKNEKKQRDIVYSYDFTVDISDGLRSEEIPLMIGIDENGQRMFADLVKMPHLLVAGTTGSGKSVFIHNCILSLLYSGKSNIILIDVKKVEFSLYENIPHLMTDVCYDHATAKNILNSLCHEMDKRYEILKKNNCRNIQEYRKNNKMNYITLFIDELADLIMTDRKIEDYIIRLAQLGRAAGIHLIVATQRPDSSILSGLIRTNIPSRVCFAVQKATDSRIVLDSSGGERLKGNGDGLFLPVGSKTPTHFQSPFTSTDALQKIVELCKKGS